MITLTYADTAQLENAAKQAGLDLPIEQTSAWANYQDTIDGRTPWGGFLVNADDKLIAVVSFTDFQTHGYHYLRSLHGPTWFAKPDERLEQEVIRALVREVAKRDSKVAFLRINTWGTGLTKPALSTLPYDQTVIVDITGGDDAILQRMRSRGRRDVRKALRESPATCADETEQASQSFDEYYGVMVDTARRDGFTAAPMKDYFDMLRLLGPEHCRLYASRIDGKVVNWCLVTLNNNNAAYYYACMSSEVRRLYVPDKMFYYILCDLGSKGYERLDMMGIGSDFCPSLKSLNTFKTKFAEDITPVAPGRDVPVKKTFYALLCFLKSLRNKLGK